jgi:hypothetical protein
VRERAFAHVDRAQPEAPEGDFEQSAKGFDGIVDAGFGLEALRRTRVGGIGDSDSIGLWVVDLGDVAELEAVARGGGL